MLGVYVAGCAGGHLNPAITFVSGPTHLQMFPRTDLASTGQLSVSQIPMVEVPHLRMCPSHGLLLWRCCHLRQLQICH